MPSQNDSARYFLLALAAMFYAFAAGGALAGPVRDELWFVIILAAVGTAFLVTYLVAPSHVCERVVDVVTFFTWPWW
jgi:hypothetical protein